VTPREKILGLALAVFVVVWLLLELDARRWRQRNDRPTISALEAGKERRRRGRSMW
jgi:hypothetical protein